MTTETLLQAILDELRTAHAAPAKIPLGLGQPPKARFIYANRQYDDCLWYFWNGAKNEHEPIEHTALTGYLEKIEIETKEFRGRKEEKLNVTVRADRLYVVQSGLDTHFARGLLYTLANLPAKAFRQPIMIAAEAGESEQVLFSRIYNPVSGKPVKATYPDNTDWDATLQKAIAKVQSAHDAASD